VVMAPQESTYLDYYQSEDPTQEPLAIGAYLPLSQVYAYEPVAAGFTRATAKHILGTSAQLWTEYIPTPKIAEYMTYPRLVAFSEVVWSPKEAKDYSGFLTRLALHLQRLDALDVNYRRLD
jgi:hexosaminidase